MGKKIGSIYKYSQSQLSTPPFKEPVLSSSASQKLSYTKLTMTSVSYVIYKKQSNSVLCSPNTTQNYLNTTNNDNIKSCETPRKQLYHYNHFKSK